MPLFRPAHVAGPQVFANLAANQPKKNIRVCCSREGRTVLFCEECLGRGYEYSEMKHHDSCNTGKALLSAVRMTGDAFAISVKSLTA